MLCDFLHCGRCHCLERPIRGIISVFHGLLFQPAMYGLKCVSFLFVAYFDKLRGGRVLLNLRFATVLTHSLLVLLIRSFSLQCAQLSLSDRA